MANQTNYFKKDAEKVLFSEEIAEKICQGIASGLYLYEILKEPGFPCRRTVTRWRAENPEFASALEAAYEEQAEKLEKECDKIIDDKSDDILSTGKGGFVGNSAAVARTREQVNQRRFKMQTRAPHVYKPEKAANGAILSEPLTVTIANPNNVPLWPKFTAKDYKERGL